MGGRELTRQIGNGSVNSKLLYQCLEIAISSLKRKAQRKSHQLLSLLSFVLLLQGDFTIMSWGAIAIQSVASQSVDHGWAGSISYTGELVRRARHPIPHLPHQNLHCNKIPVSHGDIKVGKALVYKPWC